MSFNSLLLNTVTIKRMTESIGSRGEMVVSWSTVETDVPCNIQKITTRINPRELSDGGEEETGEYVGFFKYDTDIRSKDRIVDEYNRTFEVLEGTIDIVGRKHHKECYLKIIEEAWSTS